MLSPSVDIKSLNLHFEESKVVAREYTKGMGDAVADRTINRIKSDGTKEKWEDVARRVAIGNVTIPLVNLAPNNYPIEVQKKFIEAEFTVFNEHLRNGTLLMSGRHLQHGDAEQPHRNMEVFTNCSTSAFSFMLFFLLLNGSGVGRAYNDDMMIVDWANMPNVICCIDSYHPDVQSGEIRGISVSDAKHMYEVENGRVHVYVVPDSREGWAKAVEQIEWMTYQKRFKNDVLLIDFSQVRCKGSPIRGMQDRPASGPGPLITAIENVARVKHSKMDNWRKTLYIDHYLAECVLVGGARRAARMSTKSWRDENILDFIRIKEKGHLWTSNNSVAVDEEFWQLVREKVEFSKNPLCAKAHAVFDAVTEHAYFDGSGEPGLINVDKFVTKGDWKAYEKAFFADSHKYKLDPQSKVLGKQLVSIVSKLKYPMICNPCITKDSWVMTASGLKQVVDLIDNTWTERDGYYRKYVVDGKVHAGSPFFKTGEMPVFELQTEEGNSLKLTANHKVLIEQGRNPRLPNGGPVSRIWVEAKDLVAGDKIVLHNQREFTKAKIERNKDELDGYVLGLLIGDGTYIREDIVRISLWDAKQECKHKVYEWLEEEGVEGEFLELQEGRLLTLNSTAVAGLAKYYGLSKGNKTVTEKLMRSSKSTLKGLIAGLFDMDGSVQGSPSKGASVRLWSIDKQMLHNVQIILLALGINSDIYFRGEGGQRMLPDGKGGYASYTCQDNWELMLSKDNITRFSEMFDLINPDRTEKLKDIVEGYGSRGPYSDRFTSVFKALVHAGTEDVYDCIVPGVNAFSANGMYVHNCGEITINMLGAFCVIADVVPYHAESIVKAIEAFKVVVRSLMRVNLMDSIYNVEVKRTNRIGVSLTGLFEFAWRFFQFGFKDLVDEQYSLAFWKTLSLFKREIDAECIRYAEYLGVEVPHTNTTLKPAGTTSKLFGLTEGAHLPSKREYLRWVQFRSDDPLIAEYSAAGYPVRELKTYKGSTIVGFPTRLEICSLGMGEKLIIASEATPEEQYQWLTLLEKYWINGVDEDGNDLTSNTGNQVSYTLKYDRNKVSYDEFRSTLLNGQSKVRCCSVLPDTDDGENVYEYLPEESLDKASYELILNAINQAAQLDEDISKEHIDCSSGSCPVDFNKEKVAEKKVDVLTPEGRAKMDKKEAKAKAKLKKSK